MGLPVHLVRRVVRDLVVSPVPGSMPRFAGLAQLSGEPVPVLDLAVLLGAAEATGARSRLAVVVEVPGPGGARIVALAVDAAVGLEILSSGTGGGGAPGGRPALEVFDPAQLELEA